MEATMPLDDRLRTGLRRIADEVNPDIERGYQRATSIRPPSPIRRAGRIVAYAAAALLGIAVIGVGASSLVDRFGTSPSPGASAESAPPSADVCVDPELPTCAGPLEPGAHRSRLFIPPVDYIIPLDSPVAWDNPEDRPGTFTLHPAGPETDAIFFFRDVRVLTEGCDPHFDESVGNTAVAIRDWMQANPGLIVTNVRPSTHGGLRGVMLDLAASGTYTTVCPNDLGTYPEGLPILPLFAGAGSGDVTWFIGGDERIRLYLLDMPGGGNVVIGIDAIHTDFETLLEITQRVLDGITFDEAYY
jgi:hypothetical protein